MMYSYNPQAAYKDLMLVVFLNFLYFP